MALKMQVYLLQICKYICAEIAALANAIESPFLRPAFFRQKPSWFFQGPSRNNEERKLGMPTDLQSRTQYLELAEFCQSIIASLSDYVEGKKQLPAEILQNAVTALDSVRNGDPYRFGQRSAAALGSYEQVRTLEACWKAPDQNAAAELTAALLRNRDDVGDDKANARKVIELFSRLQTRALWNFEQPNQTPPPDLRELCRTLKAV